MKQIKPQAEIALSDNYVTLKAELSAFRRGHVILERRQQPVPREEKRG
jgi:hypothetical protein